MLDQETEQRFQRIMSKIDKLISERQTSKQMEGRQE